MSVLETIKKTAAERIALCDTYIERNSRCLRGQQWVVASVLWNRRIVFTAYPDGQPCIAIGPQSMPTSFSRKDAEALVEEINAKGTEKVKLVHDTDWWKTEKAEAETVLNS